MSLLSCNWLSPTLAIDQAYWVWLYFLLMLQIRLTITSRVWRYTFVTMWEWMKRADCNSTSAEYNRFENHKTFKFDTLSSWNFIVWKYLGLFCDKIFDRLTKVFQIVVCVKFRTLFDYEIFDFFTFFLCQTSRDFKFLKFLFEGSKKTHNKHMSE